MVSICLIVSNNANGARRLVVAPGVSVMFFGVFGAALTNRDYNINHG